ncbi:MAG: hypothetical protein HZY73_11430 [Micropruina sp.]|nr:MAG: hypothetical protein HZY73_11430 [Micropruina sp.]
MYHEVRECSRSACSDAAHSSRYAAAMTTKSALALIAALALLGGCSAPTAAHVSTAPASSAAVASTAAAPSASASEEPETYTPSKGDWEVTLKVLNKECFGSAGCNVKVRASLSYGGLEEVPQEGTVEVSFRIKGAEDPYESTFEVTEGGSYSPDEVMVSTRSSKAKLTAEVTDVEYSP